MLLLRENDQKMIAVARDGRIVYLFGLDIGREGPTGSVPAGYAGFI